MPDGNGGEMILVAGPDACADCAALHGQEVSGKPHPNCRCCPVNSHSEYVVTEQHTERSGGRVLIVLEVTITCCDGDTHDRTYTVDITGTLDRLDAKYPFRPDVSDENDLKWNDELAQEIAESVGDAVSPDMEDLCPEQCVS